MLYVLDEPSIGLHQRDNRRLIDTLTRLRDLGNTLIVVEHDEDTIRTADWIVDIGPGAGEHGGRVVHSGDLAGLLASAESVTGAYLSGRRSIPMPQVRRPIDHEPAGHGRRRARAQPAGHRRVVPARRAHGGDRRVRAPGKSTLVNAILYTVLANELNGARQVAGRHKRVTGLEHLDKVVHVDQGPDRPHAAVQPRHVHRASGTTCAGCSRRPPRRRSAATRRAGSRSTSRAAAARRARATARSRSR